MCLPPAGAAVNGGAVQQAAAAIRASLQSARTEGNRVTLKLRPDPTVWDGSLAQNVWLQELPKPLSKLTWDNALMIGPATAERLNVGHEETAEVSWNADHTVADVVLQVHEGHRTVVDQVIIRGNRITDEGVIRRAVGPWGLRGADCGTGCLRGLAFSIRGADRSRPARRESGTSPSSSIGTP